MTEQHDSFSLTRRDAISALGAAALAGAATSKARAMLQPALNDADIGFDPASGRYVLPNLPYPYDALEPAIDEETMRIHHDIHHAGYVRGLNRALDELAAIRDGTGDGGLIKHWSRELSFHGSGHANHCLFWVSMRPPRNNNLPDGDLAAAIDRDFGSYDAFKNHIVGAATAVEGSGWAFLAFEPIASRLVVIQAEKQQNMIMTGVIPIIAVDVWEHAYYLKYQNRRRDYVEAWLGLINWEFAGSQYAAAVT